MILSTDGTGFIAAMSEVKGKEQEARGEPCPWEGLGAQGASACLLPVPTVGRDGGSCCAGVFQPPPRRSKMYGEALRAWPSSGVQLRANPACKLVLGHS